MRKIACLKLMTTLLCAVAAGMVVFPAVVRASAEPFVSSAQEGQAAGSVAADERIGKKVLITTAGAELRTPEAIVWRAYLGEVFTISLTNGEWLWIEEKRGWLWEKDTVLYDDAITALSRRLTNAPTAENYHLRGVALLSHSRIDEAIQDFSESLRRQTQNPGAFNNRGQAYYQKQDYATAIQDFTTSIRQDPKSFIALNNRALSYIALNQLANAEIDLQAALKLLPTYPEALNNRGVVYRRQGKLDQAILDFSEALRIDPRYVDALGNRAYAWRLKGNYSSAIADLESAIRMAPDMFEAANDLSWLLATASEANIRNGGRAIELARHACKVTDYKQWNTIDTLAAAFAESGDFGEARNWIATAIALAPDSEKARLTEHAELINAGKAIRE